MIAYVFSALASAQPVATAMDQAMSYPLAGTDIGGGVHAPPSQSVTTTYFRILKHPTRTEWAYISDTRVTQKIGANAVALGLPAPQTLDSTWAMATAVSGQAQVKA